MPHPNLEEALAVLRDPSLAVPAADWHSKIPGGDQPGLYSWWSDAVGAGALSDGLGHCVAAGLIYAGQTGATPWPSGKVGKGILDRRIGRNHIRGNIYGSTFRFTLGASLCEAYQFEVVGPKRLSDESEIQLRAWIEQHLAVVIYPFPDRATLGQLEHDVLDELDPRLNLDRERPLTPLRKRLKELRAKLAAGEPC